jgi:hypothetical protein
MITLSGHGEVTLIATAPTPAMDHLPSLRGAWPFPAIKPRCQRLTCRSTIPHTNPSSNPTPLSTPN